MYTYLQHELWDYQGADWKCTSWKASVSRTPEKYASATGKRWMHKNYLEKMVSKEENPSIAVEVLLCPDADSGTTDRELGADKADSVTGGGLYGKNLPQTNVSVNIYSVYETLRMFDRVYMKMPDSERKAFVKKFIESIELNPGKKVQSEFPIRPVNFRFTVSYDRKVVYTFPTFRNYR